MDVGYRRHSVAIGLPKGEVLEEFEITHGPEGFQEFFFLSLLETRLRWYVFKGTERNPMEICELPLFSRRRLWRVRAAFCGLILALTLNGSSFGADSSKTEPLAEVNGETITAKDLERSLGARLSQLEEQIYNLKRQELDSLIAQKLFAQEAAKRKISVAALLDAEVTAKVPLVTEAEIDAFYQANKARIRGDDADTRQKIRAFLQQQKLTESKCLSAIQARCGSPTGISRWIRFIRRRGERQKLRAAPKTRESFGSIMTCFLPSLPNWLSKTCGATRDK